MRLGDALSASITSLGLRDRLARQRALTLWEPIVGPAVAAHAWPMRLQGHALIVAVDNHAWSAQLQYLRTDILRAMRARGVEGVHQLQFVIGPPGQRARWMPQTEPSVTSHASRPLRESLMEALEAVRRAAADRAARLSRSGDRT